jgi:translation initiation factor eIF-2B subunit delta
MAWWPCGWQEGTSVRVIIVDSRPRLEGKKMLDSLSRAGISCSYIMLNSLSYVMKEVERLGAGVS